MNNPWEGFVARVGELQTEYSVPGVAIGIWHNGAQHTTGLGVTNVDHPLDVTDETIFQIGSITKTVTGTLMMRLVEAGQLDLDATVRTYVPEFKVADAEASEKATVRHLLTHLGGWVGDHFHDTGPGDDALDEYVASMADLPQLAPLGTHWSYNNAGFAVAGVIIQRLTGQPYHAALRTQLLDHLGVETCFLDGGDVITHRFAVGHTGVDTAQVARPWPMPRYTASMGGLMCHVKDLLAYARFHLAGGVTRDGERLLAPEAVTRMQAPAVHIVAENHWGLTWSVREINGTRLVGHGGGTTGQISLLTLVPEHDFAVALLTNAYRGSPLTAKATHWALREYLGVSVPEPAAVDASEAELAAYVGHYERPFNTLDLGMLGGKLIGQITYRQGFPTEDDPAPPAPPPFTLGKYQPDRLIVLDGTLKDAVLDVVRRADGSIGWIRAGRLLPRVE